MYDTPYVDTASVLTTYNPEGDIPPKTDRELSVLLEYRFEHYIRKLGYNNWNVEKAFSGDSYVDRISRAKLYNHIFDNKEYIPKAYKQMEAKSESTPWDKVEITSHLICSLQRSKN
jgi:hypothetical protein